MSADATALRAALRNWGEQVVADAGATVIAEATRAPEVLEVRNPPPRAVKRKPPEGRVAGRGGLRARLSFRTFGWQWRSSSSPRPFAPSEHHVVNGKRFTHWDDPVLRNTSEPWLVRRSGSSFFYPQDHKGCRCSAVAAPAPPDMDAWRGVLTRVWERAIRTAARRKL